MWWLYSVGSEFAALMPFSSYIKILPVLSPINLYSS